MQNFSGAQTSGVGINFLREHGNHIATGSSPVTAKQNQQKAPFFFGNFDQQRDCLPCFPGAKPKKNSYKTGGQAGLEFGLRGLWEPTQVAVVRMLLAVLGLLPSPEEPAPKTRT